MDYNKILTDEEFMEIKQHGSSDYPFQYYYDNLELFDFHCIEWHWHREFEFLYVESGEVTCGIGEKQIILSEGEAIFINSKILHRFYASSGGIIPNFVCMPEFIAPENSLIYKKYILPIISSNIYFQRFQPDELWQTKIIQTMIKIMEIQRNEKIKELATLALLQDLWLTFYENVKLSDKGDVQTVDEVAQKRVQLIMQYIHENYNRNLSLDEIASHIGISKSTALNLFHRFLHTTPVNYLIGYRLQAASWLLKNTNKKVKTIAYESGFHNVDYFCRLFKKRYHLSAPQERSFRHCRRGRGGCCALPHPVRHPGRKNAPVLQSAGDLRRADARSAVCHGGPPGHQKAPCQQAGTAGSMGKDGGVRDGDPFGENGGVLLWREPCRGTDLRPAGRGA